MPWRLPRWAYSTLPVPVTLKRFLAPDLVLILGIWLSFSGLDIQGQMADVTPVICATRANSNRTKCARLSISPLPRQPYQPGGGRARLWQSAAKMATAAPPPACDRTKAP